MDKLDAQARVVDVEQVKLKELRALRSADTSSQAHACRGIVFPLAALTMT